MGLAVRVSGRNADVERYPRAGESAGSAGDELGGRDSQLLRAGFRIKKDVLPNRYTEVWFHATKPGVHQVFCTEYCGKGHSDMLARIHVDDDATYQKWLVEGDEAMKTMPLQGTRPAGLRESRVRDVPLA